jgi:hypothetical protein
LLDVSLRDKMQVSSPLRPVAAPQISRASRRVT